ncbi:SCO7613 C-terminal domain-containing membrane protein, partial [Streptomyces sp. NPDC054956]
MEIPLPPAEELVLIDRELVQLDARRHYLLSRREWLLRVLHGQAPLAWGAAAQQARPVRPERLQGGAEASAPSAQNVLLILGAVLLAVAALAFTLVSWGSLGIAGRGAVLAVVTAAALGTPAPLLRRGLRSTAEAVASVGLLLTVLDAYALYSTVLSELDPVAYSAGAAAVLAALWAGYGTALVRLRIPLLAALLAAQFPLMLAALAAGATGLDQGWALLATAALDAGLVLLRPGRLSPWAAAAGSLVGAMALVTALAESAWADSAGMAVGSSVLLAAAAVLAVAVAWRASRAATALAVVGGLAAVAALGGLPAPELGARWAPVGYLVVALALPAALRVPALPAPVRRGLAWAGAGVAVFEAALCVVWVATVLAGRLRVLTEVWSATTPRAAENTAGPAPLVALLLTAAAAAWWLVRALPGRAEPGVAAVVLGWSALFTAPAVLGLPPGAVLAAQLAVTSAAGALALRSTAVGAGRGIAAVGAGPGIAAGACALAGAGSVSVAALDGRLATFAVFGLLGAACAAGAAYRPGPAWARAGAAALAVGYAALLMVALGALADPPTAWLAPPVLLVPAAVAAFGPRLGSVRIPAEIAAAAAGLLPVALATGDAPVLALVLALAGVVCA